MSYINYIDYIDYKKIEINNLPSNIKISTMSASCKLNTEINIVNIEKYLDLNMNDIVRIYKKRDEIIKSLIPLEKKNKRNIDKVALKKDNKHFYNQITVVIRINNDSEVTDWKKEPKINLKLFTNGSIQMSGCKTTEGINIVLNKLLNRLKEEKAKINNISKLVEDTPFISKTNNLMINNFQIYMINANYRVNMQIDRAKLLNLLIKKKVKAYFEPCIRACVVVKYMPTEYSEEDTNKEDTTKEDTNKEDTNKEDTNKKDTNKEDTNKKDTNIKENNSEGKEISIFIFQKGNIIITGARTKNHIISAHKYIINIFTNHHDEIYKKNELDEENEIIGTYNNILKDINSGLITLHP